MRTTRAGPARVWPIRTSGAGPGGGRRLGVIPSRRHPSPLGGACQGLGRHSIGSAAGRCRRRASAARRGTAGAARGGRVDPDLRPRLREGEKTCASARIFRNPARALAIARDCRTRIGFLVGTSRKNVWHKSDTSGPCLRPSSQSASVTQPLRPWHGLDFQNCPGMAVLPLPSDRGVTGSDRVLTEQIDPRKTSTPDSRSAQPSAKQGSWGGVLRPVLHCNQHTVSSPQSA